MSRPFFAPTLIPRSFLTHSVPDPYVDQNAESQSRASLADELFMSQPSLHDLPAAPTSPDTPTSQAMPVRSQRVSNANSNDGTDLIAPLPASLRDAPTSDQLNALADANDRKRVLDKTANVAGFHAWSAASFAVMSLLSVLFDPAAIVVTIGLAIVAVNEFKGRAELRALKESSLTRLMWNQILFAAMIIAYSIVQLVTATTGPGPYDEYMSDPALARMLGPINKLQTNITTSVYISMIALSIVIQGSTALYYHRKKAALAMFLKNTPPWVVALQRGRA